MCGCAGGYEIPDHSAEHGVPAVLFGTSVEDERRAQPGYASLGPQNSSYFARPEAEPV